MPLTQRIIWSALPRELQAKDKKPGSLYLSAFVSPQLVKDTPINLGLDFPDLVDWPATVRDPAKVSFAVEFKKDGDPDPSHVIRFSEGGASPSIRRMAPLGSNARLSPAEASSAWRALFVESPSNSFNFQSELTSHNVISYSLASLMEILKSAFIEAGWETVGEEDSPSHKKLLAELQMGKEEENDLFIRIDEILNKQGVIDPNKVPDDCFNVRQWHWALFRFTFLEQRRALKAPPAPGAQGKKRLNLHEVFAAVGEYPELMRDLGLVLDFELLTTVLPPSQIPIDQTNLVRIVPIWKDPNPIRQDVPPWTFFTLDAKGFFAKPSEGAPQFRSGMLDFTVKDAQTKKEVFEVCQLDAIAAVPQIGDPNARLAASPPETEDGLEGEAAVRERLPTLRSTGVALCWSSLGAKVQSGLRNMKAKNEDLQAGNFQEIKLHAEDLVRGYCIDVHYEDKEPETWYSLCTRRGAYSFKDNGGSIILRHNYDDDGWVSVSGGLTATNKLIINESLFWWEGWSLCCPRPEDPLPDFKPDPSAGTSFNPSNLHVDFEPVPGTLPRLRFGKSYRMRARVVDLAGNVLKLDDPRAREEFALSRPFTYGRFEPVVSPLVVARDHTQLSKGESIDHLVIRSFGPGRSPEHSERHIVPPQVSEAFAETHGRFDVKIKPGQLTPNKAAYDQIVALDGSLDQALSFDASGTLILPYLPDPISRGAVFYDLPGRTQPRREVVPFLMSDADWPTSKTWRIRIEDTPTGEAPSPDKPTIIPDPVPSPGNVLTVFLPKGETAEVMIRSQLDPRDAELLGLWLWVAEQNQQAGEELRTKLMNDCHWMFTPCAKVTLVHAVPQPVFEPRFRADNPQSQLLVATRGLNDTHAELVGSMFVPGKSAGKLEVRARWLEWVDAEAQPEPHQIIGAAHPFESGLKREDAVIDFRTSDEINALPATPTPAATPSPPSMTMPQAPLAQAPRSAFNCRHEFGDTKYRNVTYTAVATTRFKEFFEQDIKPDTTESVSLSIVVPNTARPPVPDVLYVIPTFGWQPATDTSALIEHKRLGGGVRIYLNRPWYRSGDGEQLAVVLYPGPLARTPEPLLPYITQWGRDPVWKTEPIRELRTSYFKNAQPEAPAPLPREGLSLEEIPGFRVTVVPYDVQYDMNRRLWYADVVIEGDVSHTPFIRLALARYQPNSLPGAELSRVVLADFVQLPQNRTVTIQKDPNVFGFLAVTLTSGEERYSTCSALINASHPTCSPGEVIAPRIVVNVEKRLPSIGEDLGWEKADFTASPDATQTIQELELLPVGADSHSWSNRLFMPRDNNQYRLVIKEYEVFVSDSGRYERLAYADILPWKG